VAQQADQDEASIVDLVEAEDLGARHRVHDAVRPLDHADLRAQRFDTWFFLAEAPEDQVALHDGSESSDSVWIGAQAAIDEGQAGKRTLVHATPKNLELLAEGGTSPALAQAQKRAIVTVQPWVETRDGKRFLHIPRAPDIATCARDAGRSGGSADRTVVPSRLPRPRSGALRANEDG
jgi:hypothetical protein